MFSLVLTLNLPGFQCTDGFHQVFCGHYLHSEVERKLEGVSRNVHPCFPMPHSTNSNAFYFSSTGASTGLRGQVGTEEREEGPVRHLCILKKALVQNFASLHI